MDKNKTVHRVEIQIGTFTDKLFEQRQLQKQALFKKAPLK